MIFIILHQRQDESINQGQVGSGEWWIVCVYWPGSAPGEMIVTMVAWNHGCVVTRR